MRRIRLSPVIGSSFLALAMLGSSCGQGNGPAAQRFLAQHFLTKDTAVVAASYTVGGAVTGLAGATVVLQNNGTDDLRLSADGPFTFATALADGSVYAGHGTNAAGGAHAPVHSRERKQHDRWRRCDQRDGDLRPHQLRRFLLGHLRRQRRDRAADGRLLECRDVLHRAVLLLSSRHANLSALRYILRAHCRQHVVQLLTRCAGCCRRSPDERIRRIAPLRPNAVDLRDGT